MKHIIERKIDNRDSSMCMKGPIVLVNGLFDGIIMTWRQFSTALWHAALSQLIGLSLESVDSTNRLRIYSMHLHLS